MSSLQFARDQALAPGVSVDAYEITRVIGVGGFGVTYEAHDTTLHRKVAIKEYFPGTLAVRSGDGRTITSRTSDGDHFFDYGLRRFLDEARTLAQFHHPNIVHVNRYIEANGTAYLVMDFEEGESLEDYLQRRARLEPDEIHELIVAVLRGLRRVHQQKYLHRDIKPGNIFLRDRGPPLLLDFGSARQALENQRQSMTVVLTPGYAPIEQYAEEEAQGPYSDLYSVGATMFRCLTGRHPPESTVRLNAIHNGSEDPVSQPLRAPGAARAAQLLPLIEWLLQPRSRDRPQSAQEVLDLLDCGNRAVQAPPTTGRDASTGEPPESLADLPTLDLNVPTVAEFRISEEQLAAFSSALAEYVGPIASVLVKKSAGSEITADDFVMSLASEVEDEHQRRAFLAKAGEILPLA